MDPNLKPTLDAVLEALDRLLNMFKYERFLHLGAAVLAFVMLIYAVARLMMKEDMSVDLLMAIFGSTGLITISAARITLFLNKGFKLLESIVQSFLKP